MRPGAVLSLLVINSLLAGCSTSQRANPHILKLDLPYTATIADPQEWALIQFADGPITGPEISDYAKWVLKDGLCQASSEPQPDGTRNLFIRRDCSGRASAVLAFTPVEGGYRYLGHFPASAMMVSLTDRPHSVLVYAPCGGHRGSIELYEHDGDRFRCTSSERIACGDGAPEENNRKLSTLFPSDKVVEWTKMPDWEAQERARRQ
ncbi:MAG TPA: hypothetical protein VFH61_07695 [Thermoleophilia bacterium]|nr:hypothetical protein [Thermoleophilia bacterium]